MPHKKQCAMTEEQKKEIAENIDAIYVYLDMHLDEMTKEEVKSWKEILKELDPNYENDNNE